MHSVDTSSEMGNALGRIVCARRRHDRGSSTGIEGLAMTSTPSSAPSAHTDSEDTSSLAEKIAHSRDQLVRSAEYSISISCMQDLHALCLRLQDRFQTEKRVADLEEAIDIGHQIESLAIELDNPYLTWFHQCMVRSDPDHNIMFPGSGRLSSWTNTSAQDRFADAVYCADAARELREHRLAVRGYKLALLLADRCTAVQFDIDLQREFLARKDARRLTSKAVACAIEPGDLEAAVEMAEQGRARIWSTLRDYAYPLDRLIEVAPQLVETFRETCVQLELLSATSPDLKMDPSNSEPDPFADLRSLQLQASLQTWNTNLEKIRRLDGFTDMLRPKCFASLTRAFKDGPIILINIDDHRSDAIILQCNSSPVLVPLDAERVAETLAEATKAVEITASRARGAAMVLLNGDGEVCTLKSGLQQLWAHICGPVVERLLELGLPEQSRIWWWPPGVMASLPIHAAGPYASGQRNLSDIFVSSYTPSLLALIRSRDDMGNSVRGVKLLAFGQSDVLPKVTNELHNLRGIFGDRATVLVNDEATRHNVIDRITRREDSECIHIACHGYLNRLRPLDSAFVLHDGHLTLQDLVQSTATIGIRHLAFLALCHSAATGDTNDAPDEFISLAAGVQVSGFRSVVGTLWAMADEDGPGLAQEFYTHLMRKGAYDFDPKDAAAALHLAVKGMRDRGVPMERWCTFVHIGI